MVGLVVKRGAGQQPARISKLCLGLKAVRACGPHQFYGWLGGQKRCGSAARKNVEVVFVAQSRAGVRPAPNFALRLPEAEESCDSVTGSQPLHALSHPRLIVLQSHVAEMRP